MASTWACRQATMTFDVNNFKLQTEINRNWMLMNRQLVRVLPS